MLALVAGSIYLAVTTDRADKALVAVASPDDKYKAVRLTVSNDTPAPFCVDSIAVFLSVYPDSFVASDSSEVFRNTTFASLSAAREQSIPTLKFSNEDFRQLLC